MAEPTIIGYSLLQATQIDTADGRIAAAEAAVLANKSAYDAKVILLDAQDATTTAKDLEQDGRLTTISNNAGLSELAINSNYNLYTAKMLNLDAEDISVRNALSTLSGTVSTNKSTYDAKVLELTAEDTRLSGLLTDANATISSNKTAFDTSAGLLSAEDARLNGRLDTLTSSISTNQTDYNTKMSELDATDNAAKARLDTLEGRANAIENEIENTVQAAIDSKVATAIFNELKTDLESKDSELTALLTTKVIASVQLTIDAAQNAAIDSKVAQVEYDAKTQSLDTLNGYWDDRLLAIEEFVRANLVANKLEYNNAGVTGVYSFTGKFQEVPGTDKLFTVVSKSAVSTANWGFVLQFTEYSYNAMVGSVEAETSTGNYSVSKSSIDATTKRATLVIPSSRNGTAFTGVTLPFPIKYKDVNGGTIYTSQMTSEVFGALVSA